jgi:hypothetical protein
MHDETPGEKAAWIGADGAAVILGLDAVTGSTLLTDVLGGSAELGGAAFLIAGVVSLAGKAGLLEAWK